jgi:nucleotide-binding universal stress UspA family protein
MNGRNIVVASDGSSRSAHTARWAAALARRLGLGLVGAQALEREYPRGADALRRWFHDATGRDPDETWAEPGDVVEVLARAVVHRDAALLALSRTRKSLVEQLAGSRTQRVAEHPPCPVAVVHERHGRPLGPVVVGVDLSDTSLAAARFAAELADALDVPLTVVHVELATRDASMLGQDQLETVRRWAEARVRELATELAARHPRLEVLAELLPGDPVATLRARAEQAGVLVVGQTGLGRATPGLIGGVPQGLLADPPCTLVVVPRG